MSSYRLLYFNFGGLAEPIRLLLSYAEIDFADDRFEPEDWPTIKPTTPSGAVPVLEVDGRKIDQSAAICRYLARKCGLAGRDDWEALEIDATVDTIYDLKTKLSGCANERNAETKAEKLKNLEEQLPMYMQRLDAQVGKNGGYFVGGRLSWADVVFVGLLDLLNCFAKSDITENSRNLQDLKCRVLEEPRIKAWVAKRSKTLY